MSQYSPSPLWKHILAKLEREAWVDNAFGPFGASDRDDGKPGVRPWEEGDPVDGPNPHANYDYKVHEHFKVREAINVSKQHQPMHLIGKEGVVAETNYDKNKDMYLANFGDFADDVVLHTSQMEPIYDGANERRTSEQP